MRTPPLILYLMATDWLRSGTLPSSHDGW